MSTTPSDPDRRQIGPDHAAADVLGDGAPRYAEDIGEIPNSGTEESWSAQPHPGFEARPITAAANRRLIAGGVVGALLLGGVVWAGYAVLTAKSPNGNGAALWTAAVTDNGAVVQGINAQNNVGPHASFLGTAGQQVRDALAACKTATDSKKQLTATTGTAASLGGWAGQAAPDIAELKGGAAQLSTSVSAQDVASVANAATVLCTTFTRITNLPAIPDAAATAAWTGAITAYADAANNALKGVSGDQSALIKAKGDLVEGDAQLNALSARISGAG